MIVSWNRNNGAENTAIRKLAVSLADSSDLRVILSVFYTMVEVLRCQKEEDSEEYKQIQEEFKLEISTKFRLPSIQQFFQPFCLFGYFFDSSSF